MTNDTRCRVVLLWKKGLTLRGIQKGLAEEGTTVSIVSICKLIKKFKLTNSVQDCRTYKPPRTLVEEHLRFIDESMADNPELTGTQLTDLLRVHFPNLKVSISTVKRVRRELGWICKRTRYCAQISESNRAK